MLLLQCTQFSICLLIREVNEDKKTFTNDTNLSYGSCTAQLSRKTKITLKNSCDTIYFNYILPLTIAT